MKIYFPFQHRTTEKICPSCAVPAVGERFRLYPEICNYRSQTIQNFLDGLQNTFTSLTDFISSDNDAPSTGQSTINNLLKVSEAFDEIFPENQRSNAIVKNIISFHAMISDIKKQIHQKDHQIKTIKKRFSNLRSKQQVLVKTLRGNFRRQRRIERFRKILNHK